MVKEILTAAGFEENKTFRETRFLTPPKSTYAVYYDAIRRRGADNLNLITEHSTTIELYEYAPDPDAESKIEEVFDLLGQTFSKSDKTWLEDEQLYMIVYEFDYTTKY